MVQENGIALKTGEWWWRWAEADTLAAIEAGGEVTGAELSKVVPCLREQIPYGEGRTLAGKMGMTTRGAVPARLRATGRRAVECGVLDEHVGPVGADDVVVLDEVLRAWKADEARAELASTGAGGVPSATVADSSGGPAARSASGRLRTPSPRSTRSTSSSRTAAPGCVLVCDEAPARVPQAVVRAAAGARSNDHGAGPSGTGPSAPAPGGAASRLGRQTPGRRRGGTNGCGLMDPAAGRREDRPGAPGGRSGAEGGSSDRAGGRALRDVVDCFVVVARLP